MEEILKELEARKVSREVDEHSEPHEFRLGYVKAVRDAINLIKNHGVSHHVSDIVEYDHLQPNIWESDGSKYEIVEALADGYILKNDKVKEFWASKRQVRSCL